MNNIRFAVNGISFFLLIVLFSRCHKNGHPVSSQSDSSCLIAAIYNAYSNSSSTTTYTYDDQHRLISWNQLSPQGPLNMPITGRSFRYGPGYILVTVTAGADASSGPDSLVLNPDGTVSEHYQAWSQTGGILWKYIYASNGEVAQRIESIPHRNPPYSDTTFFRWSNGDLMYSTDGNAYTYDTTKKVALGDQWMITTLNEYGNMAYTIKNAHLQTSADGIKFTYVYDASGKIISDGNPATYLITYTCP